MRFTVLAGPEAGRTVFMAQQSGVIGRGSDKTISIADPRISRNHARIEMADNGVFIQDLGSAHGLFVRGSRVPVGVSIAIRPGDELQLGDTVLRFDGVMLEQGIGAIEPAFSQSNRFGGPGRKMLLGLALLSIIALILLVAAFVSRQAPPPTQLAGAGPTETAAVTLTSAAPAVTVDNPPPVVVGQTPATSAAAGTATLAPLPPTATASPGSSGQPAASNPPLAPGSQDLGRIPAAVAQLFPGVAPEDLPQAVMEAVTSGALSPDQMRAVLGGLFPGVSERNLPQAIARAFPGIPQQELQRILDLAFVGQGLNLPPIPALSGLIYVGVFENGRYQILEVNTQNNTRRTLIENASEPALSPDHAWLAYYSWRDDTRGLRLRHLASGDDRTLTDKAQDAYPSWAPDQSRLALHDEQDGTIVTVNRDGTDRRPIGRGQFPAWSPHGDEIVFKGCLTGGACGLILVSPDGAQPRLLTNNANDGQPAWSPDGQSLAFVSNRDGNWEIYAINRDGSWLRRVTMHEATDGLPEFAPDGLRVAFRSDRDGVWAVYTALGLGGPAIKLFEANAGPTWQVEKISWR